MPASVYPADRDDDDPVPSWVALHGVTRRGRHHPSLHRFCRALAASGATVVVPEIPEWTALRVAPERTGPSVESAVDWLEGQGGTRGPPGVIGFSFGAPQALRVAADPRLGGRIGGVVGYGGYLDVRRTVRYQLTGSYEARDMVFEEPPDPYGRWIMAANHLCGIPEHAEAAPVAEALRSLAVLAGDLGVPADGPVMAAHGERARESLPPEHRELFDIFFRGPAADRSARPGRLGRLGEALAEAALRTDPLLDVGPSLERVACPVELVHGRYDRLIPFGESMELRDALPGRVRVNLAVTRMFGHSREEGEPGLLRSIPEGLRFFSSLRRVVGLLG